MLPPLSYVLKRFHFYYRLRAMKSLFADLFIASPATPVSPPETLTARAFACYPTRDETIATLRLGHFRHWLAQPLTKLRMPDKARKQAFAGYCVRTCNPGRTFAYCM